MARTRRTSSSGTGSAPAAASTGTSQVDDPIDTAVDDWARERPDLDTAPLALFARLGRARRLTEQLVERSLDRFGLTYGGLDVLLSLRRTGAPFRRTPTELSEHSLLTSGGVTFRLDRLEEMGLIERVRSDQDRRVTYAQLTADGLALADEVLTAHLTYEQGLLQGLTTSETRELTALLRRLEQSLADRELVEQATRDE